MQIVYWHYVKDLNTINDLIRYPEKYQGETGLVEDEWLVSAEEIVSITYDTNLARYVVFYRKDTPNHLKRYCSDCENFGVDEEYHTPYCKIDCPRFDAPMFTVPCVWCEYFNEKKTRKKGKDNDNEMPLQDTN